MLARTAPPRHTKKSLPLGLVTLTADATFTGTRPLISDWRRSGKPGSRVFPPSVREGTKGQQRSKHSTEPPSTTLREPGGTWQHDVSQEAAPQVQVRAHNRLKEALVYPTIVTSNQLGLKQNLWSPEGARKKQNKSSFTFYIVPVEEENLSRIYQDVLSFREK